MSFGIFKGRVNEPNDVINSDNQNITIMDVFFSFGGKKMVTAMGSHKANENEKYKRGFIVEI